MGRNLNQPTALRLLRHLHLLLSVHVAKQRQLMRIRRLLRPLQNQGKFLMLDGSQVLTRRDDSLHVVAAVGEDIFKELVA